MSRVHQGFVKKDGRCHTRYVTKIQDVPLATGPGISLTLKSPN